MKTFLSLTLLCLLHSCSQVSGHDWSLGDCPLVPNDPSLNMDDVVGVWYVIQQVDTSSDCFVYNITKIDDKTYLIVKQREFSVLSDIGLDHNLKYVGRIRVLDNGQMTIQWDLNSRKSEFSIFIIKSGQYIGFYDCQEIFLFHRKSAAVVSKGKTLDKSVTETVKNVLHRHVGKALDYDIVSHTRCAVDPDINLTIDRDSVQGTLADAAKTVSDWGPLLFNLVA